MIVPTFVDLQGFVVDKKFIVKEVAVLRRGTVITHYIFSCPIPWKLTRSDKSCASWLSAYHLGLQWEDGMVPYSMAKRLITEAVTEDDIKGLEKRQWLADILDCDNAIVETLDAHYEGVESLRSLDACNTIRCERHAKNCALQNVFKIYSTGGRNTRNNCKIFKINVRFFK
ncbi:hypothetical protein ALC62_12175 [Cyphomyrmex costatus]|uniref:Uncharacterized protein n=1 Tax=Cyphomyrmex costatus TaxID=456900 RepID=A0A151IBP8_9HYME|nr:hypothetical protein ALC62_12175 [Cyphomyrmex costatus]